MVIEESIYVKEMSNKILVFPLWFWILVMFIKMEKSLSSSSLSLYWTKFVEWIGNGLVNICKYWLGEKTNLFPLSLIGHPTGFD